MEKTNGIPVDFFKLDNNRKPVEDWLNELKEVDQNRIFIELKKVALGFRLRRGNFRKITGYPGLWEVRCNLSQKRIARLLFCITISNLCYCIVF